MWAIVQPYQRIADEDMAKLGFNSIMFNGKPIISDRHMPAYSLYFVGKETYLVAHSNDNMKVENSPGMSETTNTLWKRVTWMGNLVCGERRGNGYLADISAAY